MTDNLCPDLQSVFTKVATHLLSQKQMASEALSGSCCYRTVKNGQVLRCAVGCLIPDSVYDTVEPQLDRTYGEIIEGKDVGNACVRETLQLSGVPSEALNLLQELQSIHDGGCANVSQWKTALSELAETHGLEMPEVTSC